MLEEAIQEVLSHHKHCQFPTVTLNPNYDQVSGFPSGGGGARGPPFHKLASLRVQRDN